MLTLSADADDEHKKRFQAAGGEVEKLLDAHKYANEGAYYKNVGNADDVDTVAKWWAGGCVVAQWRSWQKKA